MGTDLGQTLGAAEATGAGPRVSSGLSGERHSQAAAEEACGMARAGLSRGGVAARADVVLVFVSKHHANELEAVERVISRELAPRHVVGTWAEGVVGGALEVESSPAVSLLACDLPGVQLRVFDQGSIERVASSDATAMADALAQAAGLDVRHRCSVLMADPFSTPVDKLMAGLTIGAARARAGVGAGLVGHAGLATAGAGPVIVGGLCSGLTRPGEARLLLDGRVQAGGFVGLSMSGAIEAQAVVSQGCKPLGPVLVVTSASGPVVKTLGGRPALGVLRGLIEELDEVRRRELGRGLMLGLAVSEFRDRFGRDDFLLRGILSVNESEGSIMVADHVRVGMTVRFHVRDAQAASDDLQMLMAAQALHAPPLGGLLFTCNGRGTRMFSGPHHDAGCVQRAFGEPVPGEHAAKSGSAMGGAGGAGYGGSGLVPLAGMFAAGEIGPVGGEVRLHGQTASAVFFRRATAL